ncbi:MAG: putative Ubc protein [Streblomastix strix]|uniref:Putative Ubc protein n=1 Tax=Streblomastix strix TaxID=222440 RepID=A0A5J4VCD6_9EUKA|nr:MAG: putative Ubc protein [Streblomastix strix]
MLFFAFGIPVILLLYCLFATYLRIAMKQTSYKEHEVTIVSEGISKHSKEAKDPAVGEQITELKETPNNAVSSQINGLTDELDSTTGTVVEQSSNIKSAGSISKILNDQKEREHREEVHINQIPHLFRANESLAPIDEGVGEIDEELSGQMQIFVKTFSSKMITLLVSPDHSVLSVKEQVSQKEGISVELQRLTFGGKQLDDYKQLNEYNLQKEATLHQLMRLPGGGMQIYIKTL